MSTIKSKDLSFNKQEPAFLRRIREANESQGDRHERPVARPQRLRDPNAEEEDAPTYVDEGGDNVSKAEYEALVRQNEDGESEFEKSTNPDESVGGVVTGTLEGNDHKISGGIGEDERARKGKVIGVGGANKKRKIAKVVGGGEDEDAKEETTEREKNVVKKVKKKGRPIKLSFGDDET